MTSIFNYCPWCRAEGTRLEAGKHFICPECGQEYFHNVAAAAGVLLCHEDKLLLIKRKKEPASGKWDIPGGFVDPGESAEDAARREIIEELDTRLENLVYYGSFTNRYEYAGILYTTCDIIFTAELHAVPETFCPHEVAAVQLFHPREIDLSTLAFPSTVEILSDYKQKNARKSD